jgi:branched-chain amino acid transport system permease protein
MSGADVWRRYGVPRYRNLPQTTRWRIAIAIELALAVLLFFADHSLGYAVVLGAAIYWTGKLRYWPERIGALAGLVVLLALLALVWSTPWSLVILLALAFAVMSTPRPHRSRLLPVAAVIGAIMYPFYFTHLFTLPVFGAWPDVATGVYMLVFIMMAVGLNIVVGYAGLLDLGYVAFYATGAYTAAWFASQQFSGQKCPQKGVSVADCAQALVPKRHFDFGAVGLLPGTGGLHVSIWLLLLLGGIVTAFFGIVIGLPTLRLRGDYLAIVTLGFGEIIRIILLNWWAVTRGPDGLSNIPRPTLFGLVFERTPSEGATAFHEFFGISFSSLQRVTYLYFLILILALVTNFFVTRIRKLPIGRAWEALREDEIACRALGINPTNTKLTAFALGAMFGGFAGSFFATRQGFISPESFTFIESATVLAIVVLGGMGSQIGVVLAAMVLVLLPEFGREFAQYRMLLFGAAMVAIMVWRPRGLLAHREPTIRLHGEAPVDAGGPARL